MCVQQKRRVLTFFYLNLKDQETSGQCCLNRLLLRLGASVWDWRRPTPKTSGFQPDLPPQGCRALREAFLARGLGGVCGYRWAPVQAGSASPQASWLANLFAL